ncbi:50S ribosomal protein L4 [Candidatus Absconditicoccus praedator]|uniref:50S ribosomal protein L4 n=1 Tax=Candidatus Absconditicoccus praedator TaxID=2735562 RepID=UPI001E3BFEA7|nr:50S ribosomal protein L4 [Candidatus Absconditicoccus praedator]UFX82787.1 50S ribosomal protein L4 [Candidatus Absconditicoccus praedator]
MSYKVVVRNADGKKLKERDLPEEIFSEENINQNIIHEFVVMQLANARKPIASTKTRGDIKASGKKLYRQKGTGRARAGDAASPIRTKGGVVFGPTNEVNYKKAMPKKQKRKALHGALSMKAKQGELLCLNKYPYEDIKTKNAEKVLENLKLSGQKTLFVIPKKNEVLQKSFRNISGVKYCLVDYLNPYDVITYKNVLFLSESLDSLENGR